MVTADDGGLCFALSVAVGVSSLHYCTSPAPLMLELFKAQRSDNSKGCWNYDCGLDHSRWVVETSNNYDITTPLVMRILMPNMSVGPT